jgi:VanZ family protein
MMWARSVEQPFRSGPVVILLIVAVLIGYASLAPFQFRAPQLPESAPEVLLHSWPDRIDRFLVRDTVVNVVGYVPVGVFAFRALAQALPGGAAMALAVLLGISLSASMEMAQLYTVQRTCSLLDVVANTGGAALGALAAGLHHAHGPRGSGRHRLDTGPLVLLLCWLGYLAFPPLPDLSRTRLAQKLARSWATPLSAVEVLTALAAWLIAAQLLEMLFGPDRTRTLLPASMLLIPARLLLAGRGVPPSEVVGAALALVLWSLALSRLRNRAQWLAWLATAAIGIAALAPFRFRDTPSAFSWTPFGASLESERDSAFVTLFRKAFLYGGAIEMFRLAGYPYALAAAGLVLLLGVTEALQRYLPGRSAEITDPLLAILLAVVLSQIDGRRKRSGIY